MRSDMFSLGITLFELFTGTILASPHHIFEIMTARRMRASVTGKLLALGIRGATPFEEDVFERVLDSFSRLRNDLPRGRCWVGSTTGLAGSAPRMPRRRELTNARAYREGAMAQ